MGMKIWGSFVLPEKPQRLILTGIITVLKSGLWVVSGLVLVVTPRT